MLEAGLLLNPFQKMVRFTNGGVGVFQVYSLGSVEEEPEQRRLADEECEPGFLVGGLRGVINQHSDWVKANWLRLGVPLAQPLRLILVAIFLQAPKQAKSHWFQHLNTLADLSVDQESRGSRVEFRNRRLDAGVNGLFKVGRVEDLAIPADQREVILHPLAEDN